MLTVNVKSMRYPGGGAEDLIQDLHFSVLKGEFVSFLGRSGSGKTTLLRIIAGLESRFEGEITIYGSAVTGPDRFVQLLFQDHRLLPWKTVFENIAFATNDPYGRTNRAEILSWLDRVGLRSRENYWPKDLSGGETARAAIARALVVSPMVLLLDEPFGSLDLMTRFEVQGELLRNLEITQPATVLVSHSIEDAVFMSDRVHVLAARPLQVDRTFTIGMPRPRLRGHPTLSQIAGEIVDYLGGETADLRCV